MNQISLAILDKERDTAIYVAGAYADPIWKQEAVAAVKLVCLRGLDFTTDEIHELLSRKNVTTHEPRALGAVMKRLAKEGYIYPTGGFRKSTRRACHRRSLCIWRPVNYRKHLREVE